MNLNRRLAALEQRLITEPMILTMPDGSTASITGQDDYLLRLFTDATRGNEITPVQAAQLDLIRRSTDSKEPGGSRFAELIRCFLLGPAGDAHESDETA
jgi:hypothetical protein